MREALRQAAEDNKGLAAIAGAFLAGGLMVSALTGAITQPQDNARTIVEVQEALMAAAEEDRVTHYQLREQVDAVVTFVETQALLNCTLMASLMDDFTLAACTALPGVMDRGARPPGD